MEKLTVKIILTILALALTGCSSSKNEIEKVPDKSAQAFWYKPLSRADLASTNKA